MGPISESEAVEAVADLAAPAVKPQRMAVTQDVSAQKSDQESDQPRKRSTVREKVSFFFGNGTSESAPAATEDKGNSMPASQPAESATTPVTEQPRRAGWWRKSSE